ncbi:MAG: polysaccharide deacetylase family protein [Spirochaetaceae bacterium]
MSNNKPMFVSFGFDDNGFSGVSAPNDVGGVKWASELFKKYGSASFFLATHFITGEVPDSEPAELVLEQWECLLKNGHDVGNHTHSHSYGTDYSPEQWEAEILKCENLLTSAPPVGIGHKKENLIGFRTPYLAENRHTLPTVEKLGYRYDCSLEEGWDSEFDGTNFEWPSKIGKMWEMPCYPVIIPPDELCEKYGVEKGFRASKDGIGPDDEPFDVEDGKITGLDYNMLVSFKMNKKEFLATLKYTFDLRINGNRCPMLIGAHTDFYVPCFDLAPNINAKEMRDVIEEFLAYVKTFKDVQIISFRDVISWMEK